MEVAGSDQAGSHKAEAACHHHSSVASALDQSPALRNQTSKGDSDKPAPANSP